MHDCPFCRTPYPNNDVEEMAMIQARVDKKDPEAINLLAQAHCHGLYGKLKDVRKAVELWEEAAELGSNDALYNLGSAYYIGEGVQVDEGKGGEFYKMAAMRGCAVSRYNLGAFECMKRNHANAYRHWLISAKMGYRNSFSSINIMLFEGKVTKGQHAEALKGYQDAIEEMKSHDRDEAKAKRRCD
ncbi:hypothetical protein THAOC_14654 [Thalassiosira oceanica]|uniref:Sel1 repeat family protein n=1 Tax=Thalassiosira oceanica TaxID=159749 RepID=K0SHZ3_THAOC|nr:hypothetical protein THAOC_14654 [Thalassiosira oceanica]|eukprot:EJK64594.1 hypothetical protein THAOC_14654 [Thalassiosira oceanica]